MNQNEQVSRLFVADSKELIEQSMIKLRNCLSQLTDEQLWWRPEPTMNSIGNLVLHICGNLRQWTVSGIGGKPDERDRDNEFADHLSLNSDQLIQHLNEHTEECHAFLNTVDAATLTGSFAIQGFAVNGLQAINHTITHFVGHTHQIICLTRMQNGANYLFAWSPDHGRNQLPI